MADWSQLPEDLLGLIAVHLFSVLEVIRFRSICRSWRSSVPITNDNNSFPSRPFFQPYSLHPGAFLTRTAFYRVTLSSSSSKGWLIKSNAVLNSETFHLLHPLSLRNSCESLDLLNFTVTEIGEAYAAIQDEWRRRGRVLKFKRLVFATVFGENHHRVLGVGTDRKIKYWNGKEWKRLTPKASPFTPLTVMFYDIIAHKGLTYALDSKGGIWWISSSLEVLRYGPPLDKNIITNGCCGEKNLVECCGEFYIVDRLYENKTRKRKADCFDSDPNVFYFENTNSNIWTAPKREQGSASTNSPRTVGFKVYKMDEKEVGKLVEVKSLGENAFVMLTDSCFSVLAHEYYGCLQNSIYFTDEDGRINVFKVDDGSIEIMTEFSQSCFQMFVPSFF